MHLTKIAKVAIIILVITSAITISAKAQHSSKTGKFDWAPLIEAISQVESSGNSRAVRGKSCGILQITPELVKDCNNILKSRGEKKRYVLSDRYSEKKSGEMFELIMSQYNPSNNVEKAIRLWKGGLHYTQKRTQGYYKRVMKIYKA